MNREDFIQKLEPKRALFGSFFSFSNRLQTAGDAFYKEITCKQFFLLICLNLFRDQGPTIGELSEIMGSSHQNVKQIVNKLESAGYVKVEQDPGDRRKLRISRTDKMEALSQAKKQQELEFMDLFFQGISEEEIQVVYRVISRIESNLKKI